MQNRWRRVKTVVGSTAECRDEGEEFFAETATVRLQCDVNGCTIVPVTTSDTSFGISGCRPLGRRPVVTREM